MDEEINLIDYWRVLIKWKWTIALIVIVVSFSAVIYSLRIPKTYKAEATIMPIGGQKAGGPLVGALGGLLGAGVGTNSAQLLAILKSRALAERLIEKYDLIKAFYPDLRSEEGQGRNVDGSRELLTMEDALKTLRSMIVSDDDKKSQLINLSVVDKNPEFAAKLLNNYITEMGVFINEGAFTAAKRNRIFIEGQLERNNAELLESGKELTTFYSTNRISNVIPTVDVDVGMGEGVRGQGSGVMGEKEDPSPSTHHPVPNADNAANIQKQADELADKIRQAKVVRDVPQQVYLQYLTLRRGLLSQVNSLLIQQYEMAKIEESKEDLNFQVIDWARVPVRKYKPKRAQIVMTAFVMSLFLSVFYAFFREYLQKMKEAEGTKSKSRDAR